MQKVKYAGHTLEVRVLKHSFDGEFYLEIESVKAEPIEGGIYPKHFAEGEVNDAITELTSGYKDLDSFNELSAIACVNRAIHENITAGIFQAVGTRTNEEVISLLENTKARALANYEAQLKVGN